MKLLNIRHHILDQIGNRIWVQTKDQVCDQVGDQVGVQIGIQVGTQVWAQVWTQTWDQFGHQVRINHEAHQH